jgi:hypothetical protein
MILHTLEVIAIRLRRWSMQKKERGWLGLGKVKGNTLEMLSVYLFVSLLGWMDFGGWSPARLLHAGLNSGLMCNPGREVRRKDFG